MKIDEMSIIQDVMKCSKDKKYATQMRARIKDIKTETADLKKQSYDLNRKLDELRTESQQINRILAQAKGVDIVNDTAVTIVVAGKRHIYIDRAGDNLGKNDRHTFTITLGYDYQRELKKRQMTITGVHFANKGLNTYDYQSKLERQFPDLKVIKEIGCKFVSGAINADDAEKQLNDASTLSERIKRW